MADKKQLADGTVQVTVYPRKQHVNLWKEVKNSDKSLSRFVVDTVNEAAARKKTNTELDQASSENEIQALRTQNKELKQKIEDLENQGQQTASLNIFEDAEYIKEFLSPTTPKRLPELVQEIVESGTLDQHIRQPIENTLYRLASENQVEYTRGVSSGWKLSEQRGGRK